MNKKILIVEDTPDLLQNLAEVLQMEGFGVIMCLNGKSALEQLKHHHPDLIITDLSMPDMDGFELIEAIKEQEQLIKIPIAIFSARPLQENQPRALGLGITTYIKKPCSPDDMLLSIQALLKES
jgi:DNA-binding response OmpR family regulator